MPKHPARRLLAIVGMIRSLSYHRKLHLGVGLENKNMSHKKTGVTFHYTGMLIMAYYDPYIMDIIG